MRAVTRRAFLARSLVAGSSLLVSDLSIPARWAAEADARCEARSFRTSLSVSPFTETVLGSLALSDGRVVARSVKAVQQLFMRHGATEVYARIATLEHASSSGAEMGFARGLERARLARQLDLPFNPELGLWAVYGDAEGQPPPDFSNYPSIRLPGRWSSLTLEQMSSALRHYGSLVARQIVGTGARVNFWDLGNEVEFGVAGVAVRPLGGGSYEPPDHVDPAIGQMSVGTLIGMSEGERASWLRSHLWPYVGHLLAAVADGIRSVDRSARFSTHISGIFESTALVPLAFWRAMGQAGYRATALGTSYYPSAGAIGGAGNRFEWLKQTAAALAQRFGKQVFIAEMGYPSGHMPPPYPYDTPVTGYP